MSYQKPSDPIIALVVFAFGALLAVSSLFLLAASMNPAFELSWKVGGSTFVVGLAFAITGIYLPAILEINRMPAGQSNTAHRSD